MTSKTYIAQFPDTSERAVYRFYHLARSDRAPAGGCSGGIDWESLVEMFMNEDPEGALSILQDILVPFVHNNDPKGDEYDPQWEGKPELMARTIP